MNNIFERNRYLLKDLDTGNVEQLAFMDDTVMFRKMARKELPKRCSFYRFNDDGIPQRIALKTDPQYKRNVKENKALAKGMKCWDCGEVFEDYSYSFTINLIENHGLTDKDVTEDRHWDIEFDDDSLQVNSLESFDDIDDEIQKFIKDNNLEEYVTSYEYGGFCPHCLVCI